MNAREEARRDVSVSVSVCARKRGPGCVKPRAEGYLRTAHRLRAPPRNAPRGQRAPLRVFARAERQLRENEGHAKAAGGRRRRAAAARTDDGVVGAGDEERSLGVEVHRVDAPLPGAAAGLSPRRLRTRAPGARRPHGGSGEENAHAGGVRTRMRGCGMATRLVRKRWRGDDEMEEGSAWDERGGAGMEGA